MSILNQIIDFTDDVNKSMLKEAAAGAPDSIREGKILTKGDAEQMPSEEFALVAHTKEAAVVKKFPINDAANAWLSCQYFEKTAEKLPLTARKLAAANLKDACVFYNLPVSEQIAKLASENSIKGNRYVELAHQKTDREVPQIKIASVQHDGSKHFFALGDNYAMPSADFVKKAASYFENYYDELPVKDRREFAVNVVERAKELNIDLGKTAADIYASSEYGDSVNVQLRNRADLVDGKPALEQAIKKLSSMRTKAEATVFADALYEFDKQAGLTKHYDRGLEDAYASVFGNFKKEAGFVWEDAPTGLRISGNEVEKVASEKFDKIKSYFGESVANELKKHATSIFESLPDDAKLIIVKIHKGEI